MNKKFKIDDVAHKSGWQTFEAVFGIPFTTAIALHLTVPLSLPQMVPSAVLILIGVALITVGITFVVLARREFARHSQPTEPARPTCQLVTSGVFSISRNPLYLGGVAVVVGIALLFDLGWILALLPPALIGCHYILIAPEEQYLAEKFGADYHTYAASVHRWVGCTQAEKSE